MIVNASEFQKRLGEFADIARREPVTITRHGRSSLVLLSIEDYQRLKEIEARSTQVVKVTELPAETVDAMRNADLSHLPET